MNNVLFFILGFVLVTLFLRNKYHVKPLDVTGLTVLIAGLKGAGKSYWLCCQADRYLKKGYPVFSNYPIEGAYKLVFEDFRKHLFPAKSVLIFDEAYNELDSDNFRDKSIKETFPLFFQSRKLGYTVLLASQNPVRVVKGVRDVCDYFILATGRAWGNFNYEVFYSFEHFERSDVFRKFKERCKKKIFKKFNTYYLHNKLDKRELIKMEKWDIGETTNEVLKKIEEIEKDNNKKVGFLKRMIKNKKGD